MFGHIEPGLSNRFVRANQMKTLALQEEEQISHVMSATDSASRVRSMEA
jgi:hypothetical protein